MREYNGENKNEKLQHWARINEPEDRMLYKKAWWDNIVFLRDSIISNMFYYPMVVDSCEGWDGIEKKISECYDIIGTHWSKSICLPVILMRYKGAEIVFRYNFYDYEVTVISDKDIELPDNLFDKNNKTFYYQGFPNEYKVGASYNESKKKFSVTINNPTSFKFYTFMFLLKNGLDKEQETSN